VFSPRPPCPVEASSDNSSAIMNGTDLKKAAINQAKKVATTAAQAASSNGQKKRRKGDNLKPIITTDGQAGANASPETASANPVG
jgi:serine/threonine-protein kinase SRPK3